MSKLAKKIVEAIEKEVNNRRGVGWDEVDSRTKKEIRSSLEKVVDKVLKEDQTEG